MPQFQIGPDRPPFEFLLKVMYFVLFIIGVVAAIVFIWSMTEMIYNWVHRRREESKPVNRVRAKVLDKRTTCLSLSLGASRQQSDPAELEDTYVTFLIDGKTEKLLAPDEIYLRTIIGGEGWLDYRGSTAIDFQPI